MTTDLDKGGNLFQFGYMYLGPTLGWTREGDRQVLTGDVTFYVRSDGNNANSGLANNAKGAWKTLQYASDFITAYIDLRGFTVTVRVSLAGTYVGVAFGSFVGGGTVYFLGDANPANTSGYILTAINDAVVRAGSSTDTTMAVNGFRIVPGNAFGIIGGNGGTSLDRLIIGDPINGGGHMEYVPPTNTDSVFVGSFADACATATIDATVSTTVGSFISVAQFDASYLGAAYTINGTLVCTVAFVDIAGLLESGATFSGSATGPRFRVRWGGRLLVNSAGANYFPGNAAGVFLPSLGAITTSTPLLGLDPSGEEAYAKLSDLPSSDPHVAGALWWNSNVLTRSTG